MYNVTYHQPSHVYMMSVCKSTVVSPCRVGVFGVVSNSPIDIGDHILFRLVCCFSFV